MGTVTKRVANNKPAITTLPFMDIREEYDTDGNEIRAEVVNIAEEPRSNNNNTACDEKASNMKSSKTFQGKAWKKGF
eukprot:CAMPEP_0172492542 /NCGR_PEP_ID=MMETSP1066-20121228/23737_1 /TAXON_ID=671091 /ORGANISM="Coscinodiscus wailesii, Strain CCMP2513" /LENGTH=76 /DNA_ID=CAMNT_0013262231 /DNA_START=12 /DNA_END=240 /DNA_ORIENTATION=+